MSRKLNISGHIEKVKPPRLSSKTGCFLINIKVNSKWQNVWRKRESDAMSVYDTLCTLQKEQSINIDRKTTYLNEETLRMCEIAVDKLNRYYSTTLVCENRLIIKAVEKYIKTTPTIQAPPLHEAVEKFIYEREKWASPLTVRDYKYTLNRLCLIYGEKRVDEINVEDMREHFSQFESSTRTSTYITVKTFFNFCMGKDNPYITSETGWINYNPINWRKPKSDFQDPDVLSFNTVLKLLMYCNSIAEEMRGNRGNNVYYSRNEKELIAYYIFRLFSCVRKEEFIRIVNFGGTDITQNKYINLDSGKIILTPDVYRKKSNRDSGGRGRVHSPFDNTFREWLDWMVENNIRLTYPRGKYLEVELEKVCKEEGLRKHNILRHTAITFHLLKNKQYQFTSKIAGTSLFMIENHYLNKNITSSEAEKFYELNPTKAIELGIIQK